MPPDVSIVIPTYQGRYYLAQTLAAIRAQRYEGCIEIIAVDSGSTDDSSSLFDQYRVSTISIPRECFGHGYVRNLGVQQARHPLIVFLSQDALPVGETWLETLVAPLNDPRIAASYARQLPRDDATPLERFFCQQCYPPHCKVYEL